MRCSVWSLNEATSRAGERVHVFVDIDTGLQRTGLVLETERAGRYRPGDVEMAIPTHICPTSALHSHAWVVVGGRVRKRWEVTAHDRALTV